MNTSTYDSNNAHGFTLAHLLRLRLGQFRLLLGNNGGAGGLTYWLDLLVSVGDLAPVVEFEVERVNSIRAPPILKLASKHNHRFLIDTRNMVSHIWDHKSTRLNSVMSPLNQVKNRHLVSYFSIISLFIVMKAASETDDFVFITS